MRDDAVQRVSARCRFQGSRVAVVANRPTRIAYCTHGRGNASITLTQCRLCLHASDDIEPIVVADAGITPVTRAVLAAALGRRAAVEIGHFGLKATAQDDVHDLLLRAVAIPQRNLLGQDVDAQDRFRREVAHFVDTRNALAVDEDDRSRAAVATLFALRLVGNLVEQIAYGADAVRGDVGGVELVLGWNIPDDRARHRLGADDDLLYVVRRLRFLSVRRRQQRSGQVHRRNDADNRYRKSMSTGHFF